MMEVKFAEFKFPYPPTVNHCWGRSGKAYFLSAKYKTFLEDVALVVAGTKLIPSANYFLELTVTPPDRRKRDLDNVFKPILDALTRCCVWQDDSAVSFLKAERTEPSKIDAGVKVVVGIPSKAAVAELERQRRIPITQLLDPDYDPTPEDRTPVAFKGRDFSVGKSLGDIADVKGMEDIRN